MTPALFSLRQPTSRRPRTGTPTDLAEPTGKSRADPRPGQGKQGGLSGESRKVPGSSVNCSKLTWSRPGRGDPGPGVESLADLHRLDDAVEVALNLVPAPMPAHAPEAADRVFQRIIAKGNQSCSQGSSKSTLVAGDGVAPVAAVLRGRQVPGLDDGDLGVGADARPAPVVRGEERSMASAWSGRAPGACPC